MVAGVFSIAFTSVAQTVVQILAPPRVRGSVVGLFNTAMLGLRAGSGVTVGVLGAFIGVHWSLALSAAAVVLTAVGLLAHRAASAAIGPVAPHHRLVEHDPEARSRRHSMIPSFGAGRLAHIVCQTGSRSGSAKHST